MKPHDIDIIERLRREYGTHYVLWHLMTPLPPDIRQRHLLDFIEREQDDLPAPDLAVWMCKIGHTPRPALPPASDGPMRQAVEAAYEALTGDPPDFVFSGWAGRLTESELAVVEDRWPA